MKAAATGGRGVRVTLGSDMIFSDILEGEMSYRESAEFLISRERTLQKKLREMIAAASASDKNFLVYLEAVKRAHIVELERDLELIRIDHDRWQPEDAGWRSVHGSRTAWAHERRARPRGRRAAPSGCGRPHAPHRLHHRLRRLRL